MLPSNRPEPNSRVVIIKGILNSVQSCLNWSTFFHAWSLGSSFNPPRSISKRRSRRRDFNTCSSKFGHQLNFSWIATNTELQRLRNSIKTGIGGNSISARTVTSIQCSASSQRNYRNEVVFSEPGLPNSNAWLKRIFAAPPALQSVLISPVVARLLLKWAI